VDKHPPGFVGVGGSYTCTFKATKVGHSVVSLSYVRPWEKNVAASSSAKVDVTVVAKSAGETELAEAGFAAEARNDQRWTDSAEPGAAH